MEPETPLDVKKDKEYSQLFNKIIRETNKEYGVVEDRGSLDKPLVLIQQRETHALWREFKLHKGSSSNQVKPVRILDGPMKQRFFFGLLEPDQDVPEVPTLRRKK